MSVINLLADNLNELVQLPLSVFLHLCRQLVLLAEKRNQVIANAPA
jgi:hypothetical protein